MSDDRGGWIKGDRIILEGNYTWEWRPDGCWSIKFDVPENRNVTSRESPEKKTWVGEGIFVACPASHIRFHD